MYFSIVGEENPPRVDWPPERKMGVSNPGQENLSEVPDSEGLETTKEQPLRKFFLFFNKPMMREFHRVI